MEDYSRHNAEKVLEKVNEYIERGGSYPIDYIYDDLSIFDWWPSRLSQTHLKQMRAFLNEAIKLGFKGYVCFKVGASGCANGMWAADVETTDGYSPNNCKTLYRSFTPDYTYWSVNFNDGKGFVPDGCTEYNSIKTTKMLEELIKNHLQTNSVAI